MTKPQERKLPSVYHIKTINLEVGELIKFLAIERTVCNNTDDTDIIFDSRLTKITKNHFQLTSIIEELLSAHPTDNAIWDNTNLCSVSFDTVDGAEIATSIDIRK